jgi:predicted transcriptional regulator
VPKKGWTSITISDDTKTKLDKLAKKREKTIPKIIEKMLNEALAEEV